jgi:cellulose synthase/poly-beta-1,6-N-acetylglucosamine synthase-like glycosyltransferase
VNGAVILFALTAAAIVYVLAGYPILLALRLRYFRRPPAAADVQPSVSFVIAVFNGEKFLLDKLRSVLALDYPRDKIEIFVVSDGSTDATESIAGMFAAEGVQLIRLERGGKCAALNAAIPRATGDVLILTDVRQVLEPSSVTFLVRSFADPHVGVVSGRLVIRAGNSQQETDIGLYRRFESWIRESLSQLDSMFGATGAFYAMRRELAVPLPPDILLDDMYLPLQGAYHRGFRCVVEPRAVAYDYPTDRSVEFRRKVRTLAGNYQLLWDCPWLLGPANRGWLDFWSYKVGRLLLPHLLMLMAVTSLFLPEPWRWLAIGGQAGFYGLALADPWLPEKSAPKRLSSPIRTFVVMMAAAVTALSVLFVPARDLWTVTGASHRPEPRRHYR